MLFFPASPRISGTYVTVTESILVRDSPVRNSYARHACVVNTYVCTALHKTVIIHTMTALFSLIWEAQGTARLQEP